MMRPFLPISLGKHSEHWVFIKHLKGVVRQFRKPFKIKVQYRRISGIRVNTSDTRV